MRQPIEVYEETRYSIKYGEYVISFWKPPVALVDLIDCSENPQKVTYMTTRAYKGIYSPEVTEEDIIAYPQEQAFSDIKNTKLQTPLEMIHTLWLLRDVSRAFTHQLVRYRVGTAFVQESMRFFGMKSEFKILITGAAHDTSEHNLEYYVQSCISAIDSYVALLEHGVPDQDARGVLPTNILTNIYFDCSFRTLQGIFPQRLCCQAQQGEWQPILREMRRIIGVQMGTDLESLLQAPYERGEPCGYRASFDRPCTWANKEIK
jgi:flavin-dependent thymidylate synthase